MSVPGLKPASTETARRVGKIACRSFGIFARNVRDFAHAVDAGSDRVGNGDPFDKGSGAVAHPTSHQFLPRSSRTPSDISCLSGDRRRRPTRRVPQAARRARRS